jgi:malonate transporter and related proteins
MSVLSIVLPVFALVAVGYVTARAGWLTEQAQRGVAEFAFNFAMPAMLFQSIAHSGVLAPGSWSVALGYFSAAALVWLLTTMSSRLLLRRPATDAPAISMTACFGNVVMIGTPLVLTVIGPEAAAPLAIILALHTPFMWFTGILHQQAAEHSHRRSAAGIGLSLAREIARNVLLLAILAGTAWRLTDLAMPAAVDASLSLLGQAGVPCAQVALGASLTRFAIKGQLPTLGLMLVAKLLLFPAIVWLLVVKLQAVPKTSAEVALLLAAMPEGANAYLFAERTGRAVNSTSGAIALGTLLAALTMTALVANLGLLVGGE